MKHGKIGYALGCRCSICANAHARKLEAARQWRISHKEHLSEYDRKRYERQPEYFKQHNKQWMKDHRDERRAYSREWRKNHPELVQARKIRYRAKHLEAIQAYRRKYYQSHREKLLSAATAYFQTDNGKQVKRRVKQMRRSAAGFASTEQIRMRWEYYGGLCWMCHDPADQIDHVIPLSKGGSKWPANVRPACRKCNAAKGARRPVTVPPSG